MEMRDLPTKRVHFWIALAAALSLAIAVVTIVGAQGGGSGVIRACYNPSGGLRILIGTSDQCRGSETPIQWNAAGPPGPTPDPSLPLRLSALETRVAAPTATPQLLVCIQFDPSGNCIQFGTPGTPGLCPPGYVLINGVCVFQGTPIGQSVSFLTTSVACARNAVCSFTIQNSNAGLSTTAFWTVSGSGSAPATVGSIGCTTGVDVSPASGSTFVGANSTAVITLTTCNLGGGNPANEQFTVTLSSSGFGGTSTAIGTLSTV